MTTVLLDLDGVIRHFDPQHVVDVERRHGLRPGALVETAFEPALLEQVITGRMRRSEWTDEIGRRVGRRAAAEEWLAERGTIEESMMAEVDRLRSAGYAVAVLTNGTDTIAEEMVSLGLDVRFDAIFNSAELGVAKPDRRAFEQVVAALGASPTEVFFTDDSRGKLAGAIEIGMVAELFTGVDAFRRCLAELGFGIR